LLSIHFFPRRDGCVIHRQRDIAKQEHVPANRIGTGRTTINKD
jgi:hypothetical protein